MVPVLIFQKLPSVALRLCFRDCHLTKILQLFHCGEERGPNSQDSRAEQSGAIDETVLARVLPTPAALSSSKVISEKLSPP